MTSELAKAQARLARDKARLAEVCALVDANRADAEQLYAERDGLLRQLKAEGVQRAELQELSGLGTAALKWSLSGGRSARTAAKKAPVKKRTAKKRAKAKR